IAPTIATALGGPVAGIAVKQLTDALGSKPGDQSAAEKALIGATPEQILALQNAERDFLLQMEKLGIDRDKLAFDDTASARAREVAVKDWTPRILAYAVVALTFGIEGFILVHGQPTTVDGVVLGRVLGTLDAATMLVLSYYFGTSASSRAKDETLAQIA